MDKIGKSFALILTLIIAMSCLTTLTVKPASAQMGVTTPSIPGFGVSFRTYPHYIQPVYGVDNATGKAILLKEGHTEEYKRVEVSIAGQPFLRYNDSAGHLILLFYDVRWKGNHDSSWQTFPYEDGMQYYTDAADPWEQSIGVFIPLGFKGIDNGASAMQLLDPTATQIDFQVRALIGYYDSNYAFIGKSSEWSNTQTVAIQASSSSPSPSPTVPELSWLAIVPLLASSLFIAIILIHRKHHNNSNQPLPSLQN